MSNISLSRRSFVTKSVAGAVLASSVATNSLADSTEVVDAKKTDDSKGSQRLSLDQLKKWEALQYGMFIHFGMSTFVSNELPTGNDDPIVYAPDRLDVDQWVSVARDSGMKYAVLTTKHVAGHCLWPSKQTHYSVAASGNKTDVVEEFVKACERRGVLPGFYYCSWDNHHRFGSVTYSDARNQPENEKQKIIPYTTSLYQSFQTAQITELLTQYGSIAEVWIDIPGVLGRGYRQFLYNHIAELQPESIIMMNSGIGTGENYRVDYAWPSDLIAIERKMPPEAGHQPWRTIEGKRYYMPGEICDPIGKEWFYVDGDVPRADEDLKNLFDISIQRGVNLLLDVPPDKHGVIPKDNVEALKRLRRNVKI